MYVSAILISAFLMLSGCTGAIAPTNEGDNPAGGSFKNAKGDGSGEGSGAATGEGSTSGGATTAAAAAEGGDPTDSGEADPVGEAIDVTGGFTGLDLKYIYATHRPSYELNSFTMPATLTFTMTEYSTGTKKVSAYECLDCDDTVVQCFCAKDDNKDDDKCTGGSGTLEYNQFSVTFSAKNSLVTLQDGQVHQVSDTGYPKKKDYELKLVPTDFLDPNYSAFTTANQLEGMAVNYTFVSTDAAKIKSRNSVIGTLDFAADITASSKEFEFDLDITFKKNATLGDNNDDQALKGKFKGPIYEHEEPVAYPTNCALPEKYVKIVYE